MSDAKTSSHNEDLEWEQRLEALRRSAELSIDARGRWWQRDVAFEHPRIIAALSRGLDWKVREGVSEGVSEGMSEGMSEGASEGESAVSTSRSGELDEGRELAAWLAAHEWAPWLGEATVKLGAQWCYVECDVTPFLGLKLISTVRSPDSTSDSTSDSHHGPSSDLTLTLNNGERWPLGPLKLIGDVLWTRLTPDRVARLSPDAQLQAGEWLTELDSGELALELGERRWLIE